MPAPSLHAFLTRLIWLCVGPLGVLSIYLAIERVRDVQDNRDREARGIATTLAGDVDQFLNARIGALGMLAQSPLIDVAARRAELYEEAQAFRRSFGGHVIVADPGLHMLLNTRVPFGTALPPLPVPKGRAAVPIAFASGRPAVGDLFIGPVAKEPLVAVAAPALRDGRAAFVVLTVFEVRQFQAQLEAVGLPAGWSLALLDGSGGTMARRAAPGFNPATDVDAGGRFTVKSALSSWSVVLDIPRDIYRAPLLEAAATLALAVAAATLAGVVGGTLAGRRLARSVASLAQTPPPGAPPPPITEIAAVRCLLDDAAQRREAAEATLLVSEQRFRRLFYEAPLPQALVTRDGVLAGLNARFVQVFGYGLDDIPTLDDWWQRAYPDPRYRAEVMGSWQAALAQAETATVKVAPIERRVSCRDGTVRTMVVSGIGIGDDFLSTFFDVTERKQAEAALRESVGLYQRTLDSMLEGCQLIDFGWRYLYLNPAAARQHHGQTQSLVGRTLTQVYPDIEATPVFAMLQRCMRERIAQHSEIEFVFADGTPAWFDLNVQPAPEGVAVFSVDITERKRVEEVRQRLAAIVEASDDAIVSSTVDGLITSWNRGAERTFGFAPDEVIGRPVHEVLRSPHGLEEARAEERRLFDTQRGGAASGAQEVVRLHRQGQPVTLSVVTGVIRDAQGEAVALSAILRDITLSKRRDAELQRLLAEQAQRDVLMRELTARLRTLREEECTRISRQVHDELGQLLTGLKMDVRWMTRRLAAGAAPADLAPKLAEAEALIDQTVATVQRIAVELRPSALDTLGLPAAIRDEARRFEARTGIAAALQADLSSLPDAAVATALFRILQELLTNIARHAQASALSITLADDGDAWILQVRDDGVGIPVETARRATSLGLLGMTERAEALGGAFRIERCPQGGTLATVRVPHSIIEPGAGHAAHPDCR